MKLSWGTGIAITLAAFMSFILFLVFQTTQVNHDLDAADYYKQEINYQQKIEAKANFDALNQPLQVQQDESSLTVHFPKTAEEGARSGELHFFRPDNSRLDVLVDLEPTAGSQQIDKDQLLPGKYRLRLSWQQDQRDYFTEQTLFIF